MEIVEERRFAGGGMNKDLDYTLVQNPDYTDAQNVRQSPQQQHNAGSISPILGNELAFEIGEVVAQDKVVSILVNTENFDGTPRAFTFNFNATGIAYATFTASFSGANIAAFKTFFDSNIPVSYSSYISTATNGVNQLLVTIDTVDVDITISPDTDVFTSVDTLQELILPAQEGKLIPIASKDLNGTLYIWSAVDPDAGAGEIGRATYDESYGVWNYTRSLRSVEFNFGTKHQPDTPQVEQDNYRVSAYWVDGKNRPRLTYIPTINTTVSLDATKQVVSADVIDAFDFSRIAIGDVVTICGEQRIAVSASANSITVSVPFSRQYSGVQMDVQDICLRVKGTGTFDYGSINLQTSQTIVGATPEVNFVDVLVGGNVTSGNKRYVARGLTADFVAGDWSRVSDAINVYSSQRTPTVVGDTQGTNTGKYVELLVTNIDPNIFSYVEVGVIEYDGAAASASIFKRVPVTGTQVRVTHLGNEVGSTELDVAELSDLTLQFQTAQTSVVIDNRYVIGNVQVAKIPDLQDWALGITHAITRTTLPQTPRCANGGSIATLTLEYGEYQNPQNVSGFGSFMLNEVYRCGIRIEFTNGSVGNFWIDDIKVDANPNNITNGMTWNGITLTGRRTGTVPNYDLTDTNGNVYTYGITFGNLDWEYDVDGTPLRDLVSKVEFVRAPVIREILFTGVGMPSFARTIDGVPLVGFRRPFFSVGVLGYNESSLDRNYLTIYSPDIYLGGNIPSYSQNDKIISYGTPRFKIIRGVSPVYSLMTGCFSAIGFNTIFQTLDVQDAAYLDKAESSVLGNNIFQNTNGNAAGTEIYYGEKCFAVKLDGLQTFGDPAYIPPYYHVAYYREITYTSPDDNKYGAVAETLYEPFGQVYNGDLYGTQTWTVYGNDVFNQITHFKNIYPINNGSATSSLGSALSYYSSNVINSQMRNYDDEDINLRLFPNSFTAFPLATGLELWINYRYLDIISSVPVIIADQFSYDHSYDYNVLVQSEVGFNPNIPQKNSQPTAIYYSDVKPQDGLSDNYRIFRPNNVKYLSNTDGAITALRKLNYELYTIQEANTSRQFFNTRGTLQVSDGSQVLIGDGTVFGRDGVRITRYGSKHLHAVILGQSPSGDDTMYWFDTLNHRICRLSGNGVTVLSEQKGLQSFLNEYTALTNQLDQPAYAFGIHGTFDTRYREAIFTFRVAKNLDNYSSSVTYNQGDVMQSTVQADSNFYSLPVTIYRAKQTVTGVAPTGADNDPNWEFVGLNDPDYYNWFTLVYSEYTGKFSSFYGFQPKIYLQWQDTYLSPRPTDDSENKLYIHNRGDLYCKWWNIDSDVYEENPTITVPFNMNNGYSKRYLTTYFDSTAIPFRIDFEGVRTGITSYLEQSEIKVRRDFYVAPIKNDSRVTVSNPLGLNSLDTGNVKDSAMLLTYNFGNEDTSRWLRRIIIRARNLFRMPQK